MLHRPMAAVAVDVLVEESETTGHDSDGTPSPDSQTQLGTLATSASKEAATDTDDLDLTGALDADFEVEVVQPERCRVCQLNGPEVEQEPKREETEEKRRELEENSFNSSKRELKEEREKSSGEEKSKEMKSDEEKSEIKSEDEEKKNSESKEMEGKEGKEGKPFKPEASKSRERSSSSVRVRIVPPRPQSDRSNGAAATGGSSRSSSVKERPRTGPWEG